MRACPEIVIRDDHRTRGRGEDGYSQAKNNEGMGNAFPTHEGWETAMLAISA